MGGHMACGTASAVTSALRDGYALQTCVCDILGGSREWVEGSLIDAETLEQGESATRRCERRLRSGS